MNNNDLPPGWWIAAALPVGIAIWCIVFWYLSDWML